MALSNFLAVVISGLIIFTATTFYTDLYKQPNIDISFRKLGIHNNTDNYEVEVKNDGRITANNLRLTLNPNSDIIDKEEVWAPESINFTGGSRDLVATIPRLPPGTTIVINTSVLPVNRDLIYRAFATYDQGSTQEYRIFNDRNENADTTQSIGLINWLLAIPLPLLTGVSALALAIVSGLYYVRKKRFRIPYTISFPHAGTETETKAKIIPDEPIGGTVAAGFNEYARSLAYTIESSSPRFSIGVFGGAGVGKTTLIKLINQKLDENDNILTVWFNPWRYERERYLGVIPFLRSLKIELVNKNKGGSNIWKGIEKGVDHTYSAFMESTVAAAIPPKENEPGLKKLDERLNPFRAEANFFQNKKAVYFHAHFSDFLREALINAIGKIQDLRIVVFIDDLDRCVPEQAMEVLDSLKSYFSIDGIVYVIAMNISTIDTILRIKYGEGSILSGIDYLASLVQLPFQIPPWTEENLLQALEIYTSYQGSDIMREIRNNAYFVKFSATTPRELKRFINSIIIARSVYEVPVVQLVVIQVLRFRRKWNKFLGLITPDDIRENFFSAYKELKKVGKSINNREELNQYIKGITKEDNNRSATIFEIYQEVIKQGEELTNFLDAGADDILLHINKMEDFRRPLETVK